MRSCAERSLKAGTVPRSFALAAVVLALIACSGPEPPREPTPAQVALGLFELAATDDRTDEQLAATIEIVPRDASRVALLEALDALGPVSAPEVERVEPLADLGLTVVDLRAELPGAGSARYSVQVAVAEDGAWKVRWFGGPGVEWPRHRRPRGEGLSSSPPPGGDG
jgi:hypothetical protein